MKVLLVNPATVQSRNRGEFGAFPNGLLYMAAVLENAGHQVAVLDSNVDDRQPADFATFKPDIVGFSVLTGPNIADAIEQSLEFKKLFPDIKVVWGNVHASMLPQETLAEPYIDYVVIGAGEYTLLELADHLEKGNDDLTDIPGLAFKQDGKIIINEMRPFVANLDELPDPAWHLVDVSKYWDITLSTSRGCPFRCTFCYNKAFHRGQRGELSAERAVGQIEELQKRYGARKIKFYEDNFTANRKRLRQFCQLIIDRKIKIKWDCETRAGLDEEDISLMARAGCITTGLGVESASPRILEFLHKGTTIEQIEKTFWLLVKYKILPRIYIIGGLPTETVDEFQMTQRLIRRLDSPPYQYMMYLPYPGTALYDYCLEQGLITPPTRLGDWARFTLQSATQTNLSLVPQEMIDEAKARFTSVYALRPLRFTLKHNPAYFMSLFLNPKKLWRAMSNFTRYYLTRPVEWSRSVLNRGD